jgi:uncharacterized FlaG/YvyC family protein
MTIPTNLPVSAGRDQDPARPLENSSSGEPQERRQILAAARELDLPEMRQPNRGLRIELDPETRTPVVLIEDRDSGEVILQIPGRDVLARAQFHRSLQSS